MDCRSLFYADYMIDWPRSDVMRNMLLPNLALCVGRAGQSIGSAGWSLAFVSNRVTDMNLFYRGGNVSFPLYLYETTEGFGVADASVSRRSNLVGSLASAIRDRLSLEIVVDQASDWQGVVNSRDVVHYMYGALSSPAYRSRYAEFLKIGFPRIPLTSDRELFRELCRLGSRLVTLHLMEADDLAPVTTYPVPGDNRVEKVRYTEPGQGAEQGRVWINATQHFEGVPPEVWEFHVGGYQVCAKWLKDRKGRQLNYEDLTHYQYVVAAFAETIALMREIDEIIEAHGGWPIA